jgi:LPXTG-motif cell wall-anchored protein
VVSVGYFALGLLVVGLGVVMLRRRREYAADLGELFGDPEDPKKFERSVRIASYTIAPIGLILIGVLAWIQGIAHVV